MNYKKNNKGVTLVSLVVTVVILMLLAGVIITLNSKNSGVLDIANQKKEETELMSVKEEIKSFLTENSPSNYEELVDALKNYGTIENEDDPENATITTNKGNYKILVKEIWNVRTLDTGLKVGDLVNYNPEGATYKISGEYSGTGTDETVTLPANSQIVWKIISISKETGKVSLIPINLNNMSVTLKGADGYNNAVKILNDLCNTLFSDSLKKVDARNINIEDIEKIISNEEELKGSTYSTEKVYQSAKYPNIATEKISNSKQEQYFKGKSDATELKTVNTYYSGKVIFNSSEYENLFVNGTYWVSSRAINNSDNAEFYVRTIENITEGTTLKGAKLFDSNNLESQATYSILPVISVDKDRIIKEDVTKDGNYSIKGIN